MVQDASAVATPWFKAIGLPPYRVNNSVPRNLHLFTASEFVLNAAVVLALINVDHPLYPTYCLFD